MDSNEVSHLDVHYLTIEKLEGKILIFTAASGLDLHIVKIDFTFAHCGLGWSVLWDADLDFFLV